MYLHQANKRGGGIFFNQIMWLLAFLSLDPPSARIKT